MSAKILSACALVAVAELVLAATVVAQSDNQVAFVHVAGAQQRLRYLATAKIWSDPGEVTPEMVLEGRPLKQSEGLEAALRGEPLPCTFATPGKDLGGNTPKFACLTPGGTTIRVKYSDGSKDGNREIFSAVAAAKLLWTLGFVIRSDLSDHDRLPRLPGRPDGGLGTTRQTLVPRNIPARGEPSGHG